MQRTLKLVVLLATSLLAVACSNPNSNDPRQDEGEAAAIAYAECMREHGFDWPDPVLTEQGWDIRTPEGIDPDSNEFEVAQEECDRVYRAALPDVDVSPEDRARLENEMEQMLVFAACMRDQGIDFPDPQFEEDGISGPAGPMDGDWDSFEKARTTCEEETGAPMP